MEKATFWEHIEELRKALIKILFIVAAGTVCSLIFYKPLMHILTLPFQLVGNESNRLIILAPTDGLMMILKGCFWFGLVATSPIWTYCIVQFIAPALHAQEKKLIVPFFFVSLVFLVCGFLFGYFITVPFANQYFKALNGGLGENFWTLSHYIDYTLMILFATALAFEMGVVVFFLVHCGILSAKLMAAKRRFAIIGIFTLSAILTPPDIFTQLMLAIPLTVLYEMAILYAYLRKKKEKDCKEKPSYDHFQ